MTVRNLGLATALGLLLATGCGGSTQNPDGGGDAGPLPDICNDPTSAQMTPACQLAIVAQVGDGGIAGQQYFIDHVGKQLWLWIQLPATLPSRALLHLVAGYDVPSTPVDLAVNLLTADQKTSLARGVDNHGAGHPRPIDLVVELNAAQTPPGSILFVQATDSANSHDDVHNPFSIYVDLVADPDQNTGVTPVTLGAADGNGVQTGTCTYASAGPCQGILSVAGRIDTFSVAIPSITHPILYFDIAGPTVALAPPPAYDMAYQVLNAAGVPIYTGQVANQFAAVNLSDAVSVIAGQTYTINVLGVNPLNSALPADGDLRLTYTLTVLVMPDKDLNEPNDNPGASTPINFGSVGQTQTITGRLAYHGDHDWYALNFPASGGASRLHYKITPTNNGGRYPPVNPPPDRTLHVELLIEPQSGTTAAQICMSDPPCPRDPEFIGSGGSQTGTNQQALFESLCTDGDGDGGALCLLAGRSEGAASVQGFMPLQNFEGLLPLQGNGAQTIFLDYSALEVTTGGAVTSYSDDLDYTLTLDWQPLPGQGPSSLASPIPFTGGQQSGVLGVGYGYLNRYDLTEMPPVDVRGSDDYDATPSTADVYEMDVPANLKNAPLGATWQLGWQVTGASGAPAPAESLLLDVQFCDVSTGAPGQCIPVSGPASGADQLPGLLSYSSIDYKPWWDPSGSGWYTGGNLSVLWDQQAVSGGYSVNATPFSCTCIQPDFLPFGKFYVTVLGGDRTAWTDTNYTLSMALTAYPQSFGLDGGLTYSCPIRYSADQGYPDAGDVDGGLIDAGVTPGCQFISGF